MKTGHVCPWCKETISVPNEKFDVEFDYDTDRIMCWNYGACPSCGKMISVMEEFVLKSSWIEIHKGVYGDE